MMMATDKMELTPTRTVQMPPNPPDMKYLMGDCSDILSASFFKLICCDYECKQPLNF